MAKKSLKKFIKHVKFRNKPTQRLMALLVVIIVAGIGVRLLIGTHAASPYATNNADKGTLSANATSVPDTKANDGHGVQFGSTTSSCGGGSVLPTPTSLDSTYKVVSFDDEFCGTTLNTTSKWETCIWYDPCHSATDVSDANGGTADPANVFVNNGLTLEATSSTPTNAQSWGVGYIDTAPYYQTPSGNYYVEFKAKCPPAAPGLWPALVLYEDGDIAPAKPDYAEFDLLERVSQPQSGGTYSLQAWQSWHDLTYGVKFRSEIGGVGVDLTGWNTYGLAVSSSGSMQFYFNGNANGPAFAGGSNATEGMFLNAVMSTGGTPNDGWAGVPTAATPSPSSMNVAYIRVFTP